VYKPLASGLSHHSTGAPSNTRIFDTRPEGH